MCICRIMLQANTSRQHLKTFLFASYWRKQCIGGFTFVRYVNLQQLLTCLYCFGEIRVLIGGLYMLKNKIKTASRAQVKQFKSSFETCDSWRCDGMIRKWILYFHVLIGGLCVLKIKLKQHRKLKLSNFSLPLEHATVDDVKVWSESNSVLWWHD